MSTRWDNFAASERWAPCAPAAAIGESVRYDGPDMTMAGSINALRGLAGQYGQPPGPAPAPPPPRRTRTQPSPTLPTSNYDVLRLIYPPASRKPPTSPSGGITVSGN